MNRVPLTFPALLTLPMLLGLSTLLVGCGEAADAGPSDGDFAELTARLDDLEATIADQDAAIADQDATLADQGAAITDLESANAALKAEVDGLIGGGGPERHGR